MKTLFIEVWECDGGVNRDRPNIQQLVNYARHKLKEDPETKDGICTYFDGFDDFQLSAILTLENMWATHSREEFINTENIALDILALFLKRKIVLKPIFRKSPTSLPEESQTTVFQEQFEDTYYIFCVRAHLQSFYVPAVFMNTQR